MVGAILTQNVNWNNVEKALSALRDEDLLDPNMLLEVDESTLQELIKPTGFYRQKTKRLKRLCRAVVEAGSTQEFLEQKDLERKLLDIKGIGPETADSIALYAGDVPVFVVDSYTKRILKRVNRIEGSYKKVQNYLEGGTERDVVIYGEFHALLVELGKNICKKDPDCRICPLKSSCLIAQKNVSTS